MEVFHDLPMNSFGGNGGKDLIWNELKEDRRGEVEKNINNSFQFCYKGEQRNGTVVGGCGGQRRFVKFGRSCSTFECCKDWKTHDAEAIYPGRFRIMPALQTRMSLMHP